MKTLIDKTWRPAKKTSGRLKAMGYTQDQLNSTGKVFIERYSGKELASPSNVFESFVKRSSAAHGIKREIPKQEIQAAEKRELDIKNRSKDASKKAAESKKIDGAMSPEEVAEWMSKRRFA